VAGWICRCVEDKGEIRAWKFGAVGMRLAVCSLVISYHDHHSLIELEMR